jgi:hypothetical protein
MMHLCSMEEEGMAEIDGTGFTGGERLRPLQCGCQFVRRQVRRTRLARRFEKPRDVPMRSDLDPRGRIAFSDVREQEQHQQRATARGDVCPPRRKVMLLVRITGLTGKADIDVPTGITGIVRARKPHRKAPEIGARMPAPLSDELVESRVEDGSVDRALERLVAVVTKSDHRACPCRRIVGITWQIAPQDGAAFVG